MVECFKYFYYICNMIGIYKITSPTNKIYIGSSNDIKNRFCSYKNLKCKSQTKLYNSLKKYGVNNHVFVILEECDIEDLLKKELYYGTIYNVLDRKCGLNCRLPKAEKNYNYMSEETKNKIGKANTGRYVGKKHNFYESSLKKLTIKQVEEIIMLIFENKLTEKEIGKIYNVDRKIINNIKIRKNYNYVLPELDLSNIKPIYFKLSEDDKINIKLLYKNGKSQTYISDLYKINQSHVSRIINNKY